MDIVITDLIMHDVDGLQILKSTKERLPEAEVILIYRLRYGCETE